MFSALKSKGQKTPEQMAADLAELRVTEAGLLRTYDDLALAAADGADQAAADRAHAALVAHRQTVARAEGVLQAVERREQREQADAVTKAKDAALSHCVDLAEQRAKAADATQAAAKNLAEKIAAQREAEIALEIALPADFGTARRDGLYLEADELRVSVISEFDRLHMFGGPPPWRDHRPFAVKFHESVDVMRRRRADILGLSE
jgi:hypothetical protein